MTAPADRLSTLAAAARWIEDVASEAPELARDCLAVRAEMAALYAQRDALAASLAEMLGLRQATQDGRVTGKHELDIVCDARAALARVQGGAA